MSELNKASLHVDGNMHIVRVNNQEVHRLGSAQRANLMVERLNRIFKDKKRDLDFITPTFVRTTGRAEVGNFYAVCCPIIRDGVGITHFHPVGRHRPINRFLYETTNWKDSENVSEQTAIIGFGRDGGSKPWVTALQVANNIRSAIKLYFPDAGKGKRTDQKKCYPLHLPEKVNNVVERVLVARGECRHYGHPCQGKRPGTHSPNCREIGRPENIALPYSNLFVLRQPDTFEVLHGQDLTCAVKNDWYRSYKNRFLRVTNLATRESIVVRVTDIGPSMTGVELTNAAWNAISRAAGPGTVKVELLR